MSTCPDTNLYSAYVDGEVPSPWKEKLEAHLASCESCRAIERRYRGLHVAMQKIGAAEPNLTDEFLASSYKKLSPRWQIAAEKAIAARVDLPAAANRKHAAMHYFALAAMFLVVAFVPAFFVVKTMEAQRPASAPPVAQGPDGSMTLAGAQVGGEAPRIPEYGTVLIKAGDAQGSGDFTLINQARMFAQDKDGFAAPGNDGYVIIRLPEMVRFTAEPPEGEGDSPERMRGFHPMRPRERRPAGDGYIINVRQR